MIRPAARLDALLDRERVALLSGDLGALDAIADQKQRCVDALAKQATGRESLAALRDKMARNQRLLESAETGLRSAARLLAEPPRTVETYASDGTRQTLGPGGRGKLERRA